MALPCDGCLKLRARVICGSLCIDVSGTSSENARSELSCAEKGPPIALLNLYNIP